MPTSVLTFRVTHLLQVYAQLRAFLIKMAALQAEGFGRFDHNCSACVRARPEPSRPQTPQRGMRAVPHHGATYSLIPPKSGAALLAPNHHRLRHQPKAAGAPPHSVVRECCLARRTFLRLQPPPG